MDLNMAEPKRSILDNFTGDVLDIPNANKKILDQFDTGISILDELPRETILEELNDKTFNDEFYDLS
jgi:hypothetical protein